MSASRSQDNLSAASPAQPSSPAPLPAVGMCGAPEHPVQSFDLPRLVDEFQAIGASAKIPVHCVFPALEGHLLPSREVVFRMMDQLMSVMFPGYFGTSELSASMLTYHIGNTLDLLAREMREQIRRAFCFTYKRQDPAWEECHRKAKNATNIFMHRLPQIRKLLCADVYAGYIGDPAAKSTDEVIFCYPGLIALAYQRVAHELYKLEIPILPRLITERAHTLTGIDIHPGAQIGEGCFVDHGTGVVIGETAKLGRNVRIYQGVTLGAKSFPLDESGNPVKDIDRHPKLEDNVIVYAGATLLGDITVGKNSVIGGNVWITADVPPDSQVLPSPTSTKVIQRPLRAAHKDTGT